jgi:hypothetical protein
MFNRRLVACTAYHFSSGTAQAVLVCGSNTDQCHPTADQISNHQVVRTELQADSLDLTVWGREHGQNRWLAPMRLMCWPSALYEFGLISLGIHKL